MDVNYDALSTWKTPDLLARDSVLVNKTRVMGMSETAAIIHIVALVCTAGVSLPINLAFYVWQGQHYDKVKRERMRIRQILGTRNMSYQGKGHWVEVQPNPNRGQKARVQSTQNIRQRVEMQPNPNIRQRVEMQPNPNIRQKVQVQPNPNMRQRVQVQPNPNMRQRVQVQSNPNIRQRVHVTPTPHINNGPQMQFAHANSSVDDSQHDSSKNETYNRLACVFQLLTFGTVLPKRRT